MPRRNPNRPQTITITAGTYQLLRAFCDANQTQIRSEINTLIRDAIAARAARKSEP